MTDTKLIKLINAFLDEIDKETDGRIMNEIQESGLDHTHDYYGANSELRRYLRELEKYENSKKRKQ